MHSLPEVAIHVVCQETISTPGVVVVGLQLRILLHTTVCSWSSLSSPFEQQVLFEQQVQISIIPSCSHYLFAKSYETHGQLHPGRQRTGALKQAHKKSDGHSSDQRARL